MLGLVAPDLPGELAALHLFDGRLGQVELERDVSLLALRRGPLPGSSGKPPCKITCFLLIFLYGAVYYEFLTAVFFPVNDSEAGELKYVVFWGIATFFFGTEVATMCSEACHLNPEVVRGVVPVPLAVPTQRIPATSSMPLPQLLWETWILPPEFVPRARPRI